jgi:hypothetical protein
LEAKEALALQIETAAEQFAILKALVSGEFEVVTRRHTTLGDRAPLRIMMALAKDFLFSATRAYRICEHAPDDISIPRDERKAFLKDLRPIIGVRDVNEHGFDVHNRGRTKRSRPAMHHHESESVVLDETSLVILSPDAILMGPLNLAEIIEPIERLRKLAGFHSLSRSSAPE